MSLQVGPDVATAPPAPGDRPEPRQGAVPGAHARLRRAARSPLTWLAADAAIWVVAFWCAAAIRRLYVSSPLQLEWIAVASAVASACFLANAFVRGLYAPGRVRGSYDELVRLLQACGMAGAAMLLVAVVLPAGPYSIAGTIPVLATVLGAAGVLSMRIVLRAVRARRGASATAPTPAVVLGAGPAGRTLLKELRGHDQTRYLPVAVLDDAAASNGRRGGDGTVGGGLGRLSDLVGRYDVRSLIVARPEADAATLRGICSVSEPLGLDVLVLPSEAEQLDRPVALSDLRPIRLDDLVGRTAMTVDPGGLQDAFRGKNVLITGAAGRLGGELARRLSHFGARSVTLLDLDQPGLHARQIELGRDGHVAVDAAILADIREPAQVRDVLELTGPDVVIHLPGEHDVARAETAPADAWAMNVLGAANLLELAGEVGVELFVNVSSHEARDPQTVIGACERITERLVCAAGGSTGAGRFVSVRLPELVNPSEGVFASLAAQLQSGRPMSFPQPGTRRPYLGIPDAAQLVLQAARGTESGQVAQVEAGDGLTMSEIAGLMRQLDRRRTGTTHGPGAAVAAPGPFPWLAGDGLQALPPPRLDRCTVPPLSVAFVRALASQTPLTSAVIRYVAAATEPAAAADSPVDWAQVERDWSIDDDTARGGPLAEVVLELERQAALRQDRAVRRIIRRVGGPLPHPDARTEADVTVGPDTPDPDDQLRPFTPVYLSKADTGPLEEEWVLKAMRSGYVAPLGPMVDEFERQVAARVGVEHALALSSGTAALHLLLLGIGARAGSYVIVPTMTFAATVNAVLYTGASPYFVDVDPSDGNLDVALTLQAVDALLAEGKEVTAVLAVDIYGRCADYTTLEPELSRRGVTLIEDAAEALGATHAARAAGAFGRGAVLSFNGNKIMTTSGGGMLLSNDGDLIDRARYLSTQARQPVPWYQHTEVGYNYRLSNVLAGLGIAQLSRLDDMIERRRSIREAYRDALSDLPAVSFLADVPPAEGTRDNYWLTSMILRTPQIDVDQLITAMAADHVECRHLWKPLHLQPAFSAFGALMTGASERLFRAGVNLPSGSSLGDDDIARVITGIRARTS